MATLNFNNVKISFKTAGGPITQVQLSGTMLGAAKTITITKNDVDQTKGTIFRASPLGSIKARASEFDQLCSATSNGVSQGTLILTCKDELADPLDVTAIFCQAASTLLPTQPNI